MMNEPVLVPMDPFTDAELSVLIGKLDLLSVTALRSYIDSAKSSLQNKALAATWRPRIEIGMRHAEAALVKGEAAALAEVTAGQLAAAAVAEAPVKAPKKSAKTAAPPQAISPS